MSLTIEGLSPRMSEAVRLAWECGQTSADLLWGLTEAGLGVLRPELATRLETAQLVDFTDEELAALDMFAYGDEQHDDEP